MPGVAVPTPDEVTSYLTAHSLESTIEEAVNDAVLKQVKNPCRHIAEILLKKSAELGEEGSEARHVSLDGPAAGSSEKKTAFSGVEITAYAKTGEVASATAGEEQLNREYKTAEDVNMRPELLAKLKAFFDKMDADKNGEVSKEEAIAFWGTNFAKVNAKSMFNEVDEDASNTITWDEFLKFWQNVVGSGYPQEDVEEEVDMMLEGGSWVDFNDGRTT